MIKQSVCIEMFWEGMSEAEKVKLIKGLGIPAIEFWGWHGKDLDAISKASEETGVKVAAFCCDLDTTLTTFTDEAILIKGLNESIQAAKTLNCPTLILTTGQEVEGEEFDVTRARVVAGLKAMAPVAAAAGITLVVEPLNVLVDHAGYWLSKVADAASIIEEVDSPNVKILYDIYHQQITEGNITDNITKYVSMIGHMHAAGVPGRHELGGGELDYKSIFSIIDKLDYDGYVGMEFTPEGKEEEALTETMKFAGA